MGKRSQNIESCHEFNLLYTRYKLLALDCFEWVNLPNGLESRYIETSLYKNGECFFYEDKLNGFIVLPSSPSNKVNVYNEPTKVYVSGYMLSEHKNIDDGCRILNNDLATSTDIYVREYARKMSEVEIAIKANVKQQKYPFMIKCDKTNEFSMRNLFKNISDGDPAIYYSKNYSMGDMSVFNLNVPYVVDKLTQYKVELENEILSFFGLNNARQKRERMIVDEVNVNNDFIDRNIELMYKTRLKACEKINKKFNLNIQVIKKNNVKESLVEV